MSEGNQYTRPILVKTRALVQLKVNNRCFRLRNRSCNIALGKWLEFGDYLNDESYRKFGVQYSQLQFRDASGGVVRRSQIRRLVESHLPYPTLKGHKSHSVQGGRLIGHYHNIVPSFLLLAYHRQKGRSKPLSFKL